uniref:Uncharacterized protein n=1 Tax=Oryza barthii TaxID=65489 RepID=A0A0D3HCT9_9ORYZ
MLDRLSVLKRWWGQAAVECGGGRDTQAGSERGGAESASERAQRSEEAAESSCDGSVGLVIARSRG